MVYICTESTAWRQTLPELAGLIGSDLQVTGNPLHELVNQARITSGITRDNLRLDDLSLEATPIDARVTVEVFDNQYNHFFLVRPTRRIELGRRITTHTQSA